jgi:hypothetical protein
MSDRASPRLEDLIAAAIDSALLNVYVAGPGIVKEYDPVKHVVTVQPAVRRPLETEDGELTQEDPALVQNVPLAHFGGSRLSVMHRAVAGDVVLLVYCDFSPALFRNRKSLSDTPDARKSGPSYPIAIPWYFDTSDGDADPSVGLPGGLRLTFASDAIKVGSGADFVALAQKVDTALSDLVSWLTSHVHTSAAPGSPTTPPTVPPTPPTSVAATNLKAS